MNSTKLTLYHRTNSEAVRTRILRRLQSYLDADVCSQLVLAGASPPPEGAHAPQRPRIFVMLRGCRHVKIQGKTEPQDIQLRRGDVLFCPTDSWHQVLPGPRYTLLSFLYGSNSISLNWKDDRGALRLNFIAPPTLSASTRHTLTALEHLGDDPAGGLDLARALLVLTHKDMAQAGPLPDRALATLYRLRGYLEENYCLPINRNMVAAEFGLHPNHVSRLFREQTGESFSNTLEGLRIQAAIRLLRTSRYSIKEIAAQCGYDSANYFGRVFRKRLGCSPGMFRSTADRQVLM